MTTRVWIKGDPGKPLGLQVFDADTGQHLTDVAELQITITAMKQTAHLRRVNSTAIEKCELCSRPTHPWAGATLHHVGLTERDCTYNNGREFEAVVNELKVGPDGELVQNLAASYYSVSRIDEVALAAARSPRDLKATHAMKAVREVMDTVLDALLKNHGLERPPTVSVPLPASIKTVCPECRGKGEVILFSGSSPCSRGCKKP